MDSDHALWPCPPLLPNQRSKIAQLDRNVKENLFDERPPPEIEEDSVVSPEPDNFHSCVKSLKSLKLFLFSGRMIEREFEELEAGEGMEEREGKRFEVGEVMEQRGGRGSKQGKKLMALMRRDRNPTV